MVVQVVRIVYTVHVDKFTRANFTYMSNQNLVDLHTLVKPKHKTFVARLSKKTKVSQGQVVRDILDTAMATHTK